MIYKKVQAALNICEHKTLPSDPGTVGETLEAVGFSATSEKIDRINVTRATEKWCVIFFSLITKKLALKAVPGN